MDDVSMFVQDDGQADDALYLAALAVEQDVALSAELAEWDLTCGDGLEPEPNSTLAG